MPSINEETTVKKESEGKGKSEKMSVKEFLEKNRINPVNLLGFMGFLKAKSTSEYPEQTLHNKWGDYVRQDKD